jgi:hypothetical protein
MAAPYDHVRAPALQAQTSLLSTLHSPIVRSVVTSAATALGLFPLGKATTGKVGPPTRDASWCITAVSLRVSKAMAALALQLAFRGHVRFYRHSQASDFGECSYF